MYKMAKEMNGLLVSNSLYEELNKYLEGKPIIPKIVSISIGKDVASHIYQTQKAKTLAKKTSIQFITYHFDTLTEQELKNYITELNNDKTIHGLTIELPLPEPLKEKQQDFLNMIAKEKDIEGLNLKPRRKEPNFIPCTALGIYVLLSAYDIDLTGKKIAIINRSNLVGLPLEKILKQQRAYPILCHSKTKELKSITTTCDIVIAALNKQEYITKEYIKEEAIVVDVGVHKEENGKIIGDVNYESVYPKVSRITPPTGGVGPMTVCMFAYNAVKSLYEKEVEFLLQQAIQKVKLTGQNKEGKVSKKP